jgi:hypothetical protein
MDGTRGPVDRHRAHVLLIGAALLSSPGCTDHTDFSGTYVGVAKLGYMPERGASLDLELPQDAFVVKMTARHYQYSEVEVTVHGCTVRSTNGGETDWALSGTCTFDVPSVGPVETTVSGGIERRPTTRFSMPDEVYVSLGSTRIAPGKMLTFSTHAKPRK